MGKHSVNMKIQKQQQLIQTSEQLYFKIQATSFLEGHIDESALNPISN